MHQKKEHNCRRCGSPSEKRPGINIVYVDKLPLSVGSLLLAIALGEALRHPVFESLDEHTFTLADYIITCSPFSLSRSLSLSLSSLSLPHDCPPEAATLETGAREYLHSFLQCSVLFFQSLTGIHFTPPSDGTDTHVFLVQSLYRVSQCK